MEYCYFGSIAPLTLALATMCLAPTSYLELPPCVRPQRTPYLDTLITVGSHIFATSNILDKITIPCVLCAFHSPLARCRDNLQRPPATPAIQKPRRPPSGGALSSEQVSLARQNHTRSREFIGPPGAPDPRESSFDLPASQRSFTMLRQRVRRISESRAAEPTEAVARPRKNATPRRPAVEVSVHDRANC